MGENEKQAMEAEQLNKADEMAAEADIVEAEAATPSEAENVDERDAKISELEEKLEEAENRYLRLQADFNNFRRRSRMDLEAGAKYRAQSLVTDLLPAIDNFERALKMEAASEEAKSMQQGMEMVHRSILEALKKEGVEPIEAVGKEFDPTYHQAVMQEQDDKYGSNIVIEEFQKGYKLKDRVLRPSMVKVNQ